MTKLLQYNKQLKTINKYLYLERLMLFALLHCYEFETSEYCTRAKERLNLADSRKSALKDIFV